MNCFLLAAAVFIFFLGPLHSYLGETKIFHHLRTESLPPLFEQEIFTRRILWFFWHLVSLLWCALAAILAYHACRPRLDGAGLLTAIVLEICFLLSFAYVFVKVRRHPAWKLFLIATLILAGGLLWDFFNGR